MVLIAPSCFKLPRQTVDLPLSRALFSAGNSIAAKIAMMAITTRSSIKVNNFLMVSSQK